MAQKPDLETFLKDPQFEPDRLLIIGTLENHLEKKRAEAEEKKKLEEPKNVFDSLFGW